MIPEVKNHPDGDRNTTNYDYKGHQLIIKMKKNKGAKIHVWDIQGDKVLKTFRFAFATQEFLLKKAQQWIDKI